LRTYHLCQFVGASENVGDILALGLERVIEIEEGLHGCVGIAHIRVCPV